MSFDKLSFFTPVTYMSEGFAPFSKENLIEMVEGYFHPWGSRVAVVVPKYLYQGHQAVVLLKCQRHSWWKTLLKVISYATLVIPLLVLIAKMILRSANPFYLIETKESGTFSKNGMLLKGTRVENRLTFFVAPDRLVEQDLSFDGKEVNFAKVTQEGRPEVLLVERTSYTPNLLGNDEYVRSTGITPKEALFQMAQREGDSPIERILCHSNNHLIDTKEFLTFLTTADEKGDLPLLKMQNKSLLEACTLLKKNKMKLPEQVNEFITTLPR